jgi:hypothetical protein
MFGGTQQPEFSSTFSCLSVRAVALLIRNIACLEYIFYDTFVSLDP